MIIALDIGATKIHAACFTNGKMTSQKIIATPKGGKSALIKAILSTVTSLHAGKITKLGICVPGFVHNGVVYGLPNIGIMEKFDLQTALKKKFHCKVSLQNDSKCFALAEMAAGSAKGCKNVLGITFGSGIGGGIIIDGKLYCGARNQSAEFGHMKICANGIKCGCGSSGCWERYSSGSAIEEAYKRKTGKKKSAREILASNEPAAVSISRQAAQMAGIGTASLANIFAPDIIVLGGSVSQAYFGKYNRDFTTGFRQAALPLAKSTRITHAKLPNASLYGAMLLSKN